MMPLDPADRGTTLPTTGTAGDLFILLATPPTLQLCTAADTWAPIGAGAGSGSGEPGPMGPPGPQGDPGPQGGIGPAGADGPPGPAGAQGGTGPEGSAGLQGEQGEIGPPGSQGIQGIPGTPGAAGGQGIQGIQGPPGADGAAGGQGIQGIQGPPGAGAPVYALLANGATAMVFGTNTAVKVTPTAAHTYTTTVPVAGSIRQLIVLTSGTTSRIITFGTGFKPTATLATGTVTARVFVLTFISDGVNLYEASRTIAMAA